MENTLLKKLQVKSGFKVKVLNTPDNFPAVVGEIPSDIEISFNETIEFDALFVFAITKVDLLNALKTETIGVKTICWIFYPKAKSKLASDLNLMQSWEDLKTFNLTPCGSAAIDETWTALRIKPETELKRSGVGNAEIAKSDYGNYVDVANKIINLPEDLEIELKKQTSAFDFYQGLSYSNRKEYVLWVLTAKQEKTRTDRISKTVEKLIAGKKNPSEK
ncbi:YdeI/OmpD-associated family protein [Pedobacter boryungensis]|uniref:YdeI/OmpD-associated family protein n=1 Tax=Pedobacter boryungensis TaxID=869962 RepID=A0ABX2D9T0_9SPHI|nr:YdeI/OmpD-associated family protein [Pedobacter boryungensis]NQX30815.1 YdeI/OmpD-associated family protein [Pedobacter boryungensis]